MLRSQGQRLAISGGMSDGADDRAPMLRAFITLLEGVPPARAEATLRVGITSLIGGGPASASSGSWESVRLRLADLVLATPAANRGAIAKSIGVSHSTLRSLVYARGPAVTTQKRIVAYLDRVAGGAPVPTIADRPAPKRKPPLRMNGHKVSPNVLPLLLQDRLGVLLQHSEAADIRRMLGCDPRTARLAADGEPLAVEIVQRIKQGLESG
jgi:hypothetical protein